MSRPRTKSEVIPVRLSMGAYAEAERRAAAKGMTVRTWLVEAMEKALVGEPSGAVTRSIAERDVTPIPKGTKRS